MVERKKTLKKNLISPAGLRAFPMNVFRLEPKSVHVWYNWFVNFDDIMSSKITILVKEKDIGIKQVKK